MWQWCQVNISCCAKRDSRNNQEQLIENERKSNIFSLVAFVCLFLNPASFWSYISSLLSWACSWDRCVVLHVHICDGKKWIVVPLLPKSMANTPLTKQAWKDNPRINALSKEGHQQRDCELMFHKTLEWHRDPATPQNQFLWKKPTNQINTKPLKQGGMSLRGNFCVSHHWWGEAQVCSVGHTVLPDGNISGIESPPLQTHSCSCYISRQIQMCRGQNPLPFLAGDKRYSLSSHPD